MSNSVKFKKMTKKSKEVKINQRKRLMVAKRRQDRRRGGGQRRTRGSSEAKGAKEGQRRPRESSGLQWRPR